MVNGGPRRGKMHRIGCELKSEIEKSIKAGFMKSNPLGKFIENDFSKENYEKFDLHRPFVDDIILVSSSGKKMFVNRT